MNFSLAYSSSIENLTVYSAFILFFIFLFIVIFAKTASGKESYTSVNKLHKRMYLIYIAFSLFFIVYTKSYNTQSLAGFLTGSFIYFGLHYVYLFSLIGLAKKSISINILASIKELELANVQVTEESLSGQMNKNNIGIGDIRESRLQQMTGLGFAGLNDKKYKVIPRGKFVHQTGTLILKIWNQKRL